MKHLLRNLRSIAMAKYDNEKLYIVIDEGPRSIFEDTVEEHLKKGYLPLGGVSTYTDEYGAIHYCQALLKPAEDND